MTVESNLVHPMRFLKTRPFAKRVIRLYQQKIGRSAPNQAVIQSIGQILIEEYNTAIMKLPFEQRPVRPSALMSNEVALSLHVAKYAAFGRNTFVLAPHLVEMLDNTKLDAVRTIDLRLPFKSFYISFADAFPACLPGPKNIIDGAYISSSFEGRIEVIITSRRRDVDTHTSANWPRSRDLYYYCPFDITDPDLNFAELVERAIGDDIKIVADMTAPDPDFVHEFDDGRKVLVSSVKHLTAQEQAEYAAEGLPAFKRALALVINALCYMTAEPTDAEIEAPEDAPADLLELLKAKKPSIRDRAKVSLLERGFSLLRVIGNAVPKPSAAEASPGTGGSVRPHWRKGHWRRQPFGPGRAEIRLLWIYPMLVRGDKGEPETGHLYQVK